jgi:putative ABC transport system permease protein
VTAQIWIAVVTAIAALRRNRMRAFLTMLGMIVGVAAVIGTAAVGAGAKQAIEDRIIASGANMIVVRAGNRTIGGVRLGMGASSRLTAADATALRALPGVAYVSPGLRTRSQVISKGANWNTSIEGTGADMPLIHSWRLSEGAFFTARDVDEAGKVAVLGPAVRDEIFGKDASAVGQIIRVGIVPLRVIGVLETKGQSAGGQDRDDTVFVPFTTVQDRLRGVDYLDRITLSARTAEGVHQVAADAARLLRLRHGIGPDALDDFRVQNLQELAEVRSSTTSILTWLLSGVAAVSLVVGGVGIMNIMLVAVTERTREIGLRAAVGARPRDVLVQFIVEALLMSTIGGGIGALLGVAAAHAAEWWLGWPTLVPAAAVVAALAFSMAIGMIFGLYPAAKASRLDPIDALRFE